MTRNTDSRKLNCVDFEWFKLVHLFSLFLCPLYLNHHPWSVGEPIHVPFPWWYCWAIIFYLFSIVATVIDGSGVPSLDHDLLILSRLPHSQPASRRTLNSIGAVTLAIFRCTHVAWCVAQKFSKVRMKQLVFLGYVLALSFDHFILFG